MGEALPEADAVLIVDSHCHVSDRWYEPVEALLFQMDRAGVAQALLVQMLGQYDNAYQQECARRYRGRLASVVAVDAASAGACDQLRALAHNGAVGVRLRPMARSPGEDPLAIWRTAQALSLAVSCVGNPAAFCDPAFAALVSELPRLTVVLEHLGGTSAPDTDDSSRAARIAVFEALARFPNICLKLPGLGELNPRQSGWGTEALPFDTDMPATLVEALRHFGPRRLMWGSDFPPVSAREGYGLALALCRRAAAGLDDTGREQIFGGTARRVFRL